MRPLSPGLFINMDESIVIWQHLRPFAPIRGSKKIELSRIHAITQFPSVCFPRGDRRAL
jgi:hypothetical protein